MIRFATGSPPSRTQAATQVRCWLGFLIPLSFFVGCGRSDLAYKPNDLHAASLTREGADQDARSVAAKTSKLVENWFGTLDTPRWPTELLGPELQAVEMDSVSRCAGPVGRGIDKVERGIYRKHCVNCHGLSGDGRGAAAMLLEPYPRDFRRGTFKFKSTPVGRKPTREDLHRTLLEGIPGTAMPSFRALEESKEFSTDVDDLVEYVRFIAIRGEVERRIVTAHLRDGAELDPASEKLKEILLQVVQKWTQTIQDQLTVPEVPSYLADADSSKPLVSDQQHQELMAKGKRHFESELTACVKCHGKTGAGDGSSQDYDEWTKDWTILAGIDPKHPREWKEMKTYGALKPVLAKPRNFHWGAYHGGKSPIEIFKRIVLGIEGTPMPPVARAQNGNPGLTDEELWELVYYVMHLEDRS